MSELKDQLDLALMRRSSRWRDDFDTGRREHQIEGAKQKYGRPRDGFTDPNMFNRHLFTVQPLVQTGLPFFRNSRRRHSVVVTWPARQSRRAVMFKMN